MSISFIGILLLLMSCATLPEPVADDGCERECERAEFWCMDKHNYIHCGQGLVICLDACG